MKVLFIGHMPDNIETIFSQLQKDGFETLFSENTSNGLDLLRENIAAVVCVVFRVQANEKESFKICEEIRAVQASYVHLVVLIDSDDKSERDLWYAAGADHLLTVPLKDQELIAVIRVGRRLLKTKSQATEEEAKVKTDGFDIAGAESRTMIKKSRHDYMVAKIALANQMIDNDELAQAMALLKKRENSDKKTTLDVVLGEEGFISSADLHKLQIVVKRQLGKQFGERAIKKGFVNKAQIEMALRIQAEEFRKTNTCRRLGDILLSQGMLSEEQLALVRQDQENISLNDERNGGLEKKTNKNNQTVPLEDEETPQRTIPAQELLVIEVSDDKMLARLSVKSVPQEAVSIELIKELLNKKEIIQGVAADDVIQSYLSQLVENEKYVIAEGVPPVPGKDAYLKYHFEKDYLKAGTINTEGYIDYRHRGETPYVHKGDLLAQKVPLISGRAGIDVYGNSVPVAEVEDINIVCGEGVTLDDDAMKVYAAIDGEAAVTKTGKIAVYAELKIDGDVDYNTGNIEFDGNVHVKGIIKEGFSVKCGNLFASESLAAEIDVEGDVYISGGIIGAQIKAQGTVFAKYIKDANIKAFGDVMVEKEVFNSKIRSSGRVLSETGKLVSSYISAHLGIHVKDVGTDVSKPCNLKVGVDENSRKILQGFDIQIALNKNKLEKAQAEYEPLVKILAPLKEQICGLKEMIIKIDDKLNSTQIRLDRLNGEADSAPITQVTDLSRQLVEKKQEIEMNLKVREEKRLKLDMQANEKLAGIEETIRLIERLNEDRAAIAKWAKKESGVAELHVKGQLHSGTMIFGRHTSIKLKETARSVTIKEVHLPEKDPAWDMKLFISR